MDVARASVADGMRIFVYNLKILDTALSEGPLVLRM